MLSSGGLGKRANRPSNLPLPEIKLASFGDRCHFAVQPHSSSLQQSVSTPAAHVLHVLNRLRACVVIEQLLDLEHM